MIKKNLSTAAFTLIELLVVITIIGILAGIALPVFNSVQIKGSQTKALAQAKQIGLALKLFASDNDGSYPQAGVPTAASWVTPTDSNIAFSALFQTYVTNESIFYNKLASGYANTTPPDNVLDPTGTYSCSNTLKAGENVYAYVMGLNDSMNSSYPIIADGFSATVGTYAKAGATGGVWGGSKAIVIHLDNSGSIDNLNAAFQDFQHTDSGSTTTANIFIPSQTAGDWLYGCTVLNPKTFAAGGGGGGG